MQGGMKKGICLPILPFRRPFEGGCTNNIGASETDGTKKGKPSIATKPYLWIQIGAPIVLRAINNNT